MYNLLIVDDERLERIALKMYFDNNVDACKTCHEASCGADALKMIDDGDYDIVLMDIRMPGEDGLSITKQIKEKYDNISVIMLTAYAEFDYAQRAVKIHADDYLLKPSRPEHISQSISKALLKKRQLQNVEHSNAVEVFVKYLMSGRYRESIEAFDNYIASRPLQMEKQAEDMKLILEGILRLVEQYELEMIDENISDLKKIKNIFHDAPVIREAIQNIMNDIFHEIIEKKLCRHPREIDYALDYIEYNLKCRLSLDQIAGYMNISPQYFSRYFKKEIGTNFVQYLSTRRIEYAKKEILYSRKTIGEISFELCFNEANYFSKVFRKHTGMTPSEYKEEVRKNNIRKLDMTKTNNTSLNNPWMI